MKNQTGTVLEQMIIRLTDEIMDCYGMVFGQRLPLVGLAIRPGCSVVGNPKEVQGLIFNFSMCQCGR